MTSEKPDKSKKEAGRAYYYVCRLLGRRDYTVHEIRTKLQQKSYSIEATDKTIEKFTELGFLNDKEYVAKYVRTRLALKPRGAYVLKMELLKKGIDKELIENHFEENPMDHVEIARELIERNAQKLKRMEPEKRKQRILYLLRSRGLSYSDFKQLAIDTIS